MSTPIIPNLPDAFTPQDVGPTQPSLDSNVHDSIDEKNDPNR